MAPEQARGVAGQIDAKVERGENGEDELRAAVADYEEAARRDPAAAPSLEKTIEGCRQLLQHP